MNIVVIALHRYVSLEQHMQLFTLLQAPEFAAQLEVLARRPSLEALHRLGGVVLVVTGLAQFSLRLRRWRPRLHRASGYAYVALAISAGASGLYLGIVEPFGGVGETIPSVLFGAALIAATLLAVGHARGRRFKLHQEWMLRSYALVLGPPMVRVVFLPLVIFAGVSELQAIVVSFWAGWLINLGLAEYWIRANRPDRQALRPSGA